MALPRWLLDPLSALTRFKTKAPNVEVASRRAAAATVFRTVGGIGQQVIPKAQPPEPKDMDSLPRLDWVQDDPQDGQQNRVTKPEDMIGITGRLNGVPHKINSILGKGDNKVVFSLVNVESGRGIALAFSLTIFDPRNELADYLQSQGQHYDPDGVIDHCNRVLELCPGDHIAAFNKGVALLAKRQFLEANRALEIALASQPTDLYALAYNACALAGAGEHSKAVACLRVAEEADREGIHEYLRSFEREKELLFLSVQEVLRLDPTHSDARRLLETYFS
jgi:tetratricopeptide (TPR) repeat protein